jgi:hypothetical protein
VLLKWVKRSSILNPWARERSTEISAVFSKKRYSQFSIFSR